MSNVLDYGRRRSRRHWWILAFAFILATAAAVFGVRSWRQRQAILEDRRLLAEQRKYREDFDRQFRAQLGPTSNRAATVTPPR